LGNIIHRYALKTQGEKQVGRSINYLFFHLLSYWAAKVQKETLKTKKVSYYFLVLNVGKKSKYILLFYFSVKIITHV
tara:strand:- start:1731 stop:1961 length:231 start_codon:yes stop_codon:yes gene_type:complete